MSPGKRGLALEPVLQLRNRSYRTTHARVFLNPVLLSPKSKQSLFTSGRRWQNTQVRCLCREQPGGGEETWTGFPFAFKECLQDRTPGVVQVCSFWRIASVRVDSFWSAARQHSATGAHPQLCRCTCQERGEATPHLCLVSIPCCPRGGQNSACASNLSKN